MVKTFSVNVIWESLSERSDTKQPTKIVEPLYAMVAKTYLKMGSI